MKFIYVDESGDSDHSDVFVMCGLMVDAYKLRTATEKIDNLIISILKKHPRSQKEFKTSQFINGKHRWNRIAGAERCNILRGICKLAISSGGRIFGIGLSFNRLRHALSEVGQPPQHSHWQISAMFIASLIQKEMQKEKRRKGHTVVVMDDNKIEMESFSDQIYRCHDWYDGLYVAKSTKKTRDWEPRTHKDRFDQIINTAFAIKSDHSTLIQIADAICYVYRRHLELKDTDESWDGERHFYCGLVEVLEQKREKLERCPEGVECVEFYNAARHSHWIL